MLGMMESASGRAAEPAVRPRHVCATWQHACPESCSAWKDAPRNYLTTTYVSPAEGHAPTLQPTGERVHVPLDSNCCWMAVSSLHTLEIDSLRVCLPRPSSFPGPPSAACLRRSAAPARRVGRGLLTLGRATACTQRQADVSDSGIVTIVGPPQACARRASGCIEGFSRAGLGVTSSPRGPAARKRASWVRTCCGEFPGSDMDPWVSQGPRTAVGGQGRRNVDTVNGATPSAPMVTSPTPGDVTHRPECMKCIGHGLHRHTNRTCTATWLPA